MKAKLNGIELISESNADLKSGDYTTVLKVSIGFDNDIEIVCYKELSVLHNNSQSGAEVDAQREAKAMEYIDSLNN